MKTVRPISFFPPSSGKGKWHAASACSTLAACGSGVTVNSFHFQRIQIEGGVEAKWVHPICCRRCLKQACGE